MATMYTRPDGTNVLRTNRDADRRQRLIEQAVDLIIDYMDTNEWDEIPTWEPMSTPHKAHWVTKKTRIY